MSLKTFQVLFMFQGCFNFTLLLVVVILAYRLRVLGRPTAAEESPVGTTTTAPDGPFASHLESILEERARGDKLSTGRAGEAPRRPAFSVRGAVSRRADPRPPAGSGLPTRRTAPWSDGSLPSGEALLSRTLDEVRRHAARRSA